MFELDKIKAAMIELKCNNKSLFNPDKVNPSINQR